MKTDEFPSEYEMLADVYVRGMQLVTDLQEVIDLVGGYMERFGVVAFSYHHLPPMGAEDYSAALTVFRKGYPEPWVSEYYDGKMYECDPIMRHALAGTEPFWWSDVAKFGDLKKTEKACLEFLISADLGEGLAIPVFGPNGRNGYVSAGFGKGIKRAAPLVVSRLSSAAQIGHQQFCKLLAQKRETDVVLSERESEILQWVVRGKSNTVIAEIVGISAHTVDTYLKRIYTKLGVSNRVMAALRGVAIGAVG